MKINRLDHLVLTVADTAATVDFYTDVLGMTKETFGEGRTALSFGNSKINIHQAGNEFEPNALHPKPGSADLCFIVDQPLAAVIDELSKHEVAIEDGPLKRTGANGPIESVYVRDPDDNLIELANYIES